MPRGNGTGPAGIGPGTGRRRGPCGNGTGFGGIGRTAFRARNPWLLGLAMPLVVAAIRDLVNPKGLLRQCATVLFPGKPRPGGKRVACDAEFSVLDSKSSTKTDEKG
jgi:hypothetical protein